MSYPTVTPRLGSLGALGVAKETSFGVPVAATNFTPLTSTTLNPDFGLFYPKTMMGQRSTQIYALQGEAKFAGNLGAPLYPINGIQLLVGSIGSDNTQYSGIAGVPTQVSQVAKRASGGSSTSFATTGVTSVTLTGIVGTFAVSQAVEISGSTDANGPEVCAVSAFTTPTLTISATTKVHTGTITVTVVGFVTTGALSAGGTTITLATGGGAYFTSNDVVTIDNNVQGSTSAETHKITVSTDTLTIADASPNNQLSFAHASGVVVYNTGNATHTVPLGPTISSFTIEKNLGNFQSEQYAGCRVGKYSLKAPMGNNPVNFTADIMAQAVAVMDTPTAVVIDSTGLPFVFRECTLVWNGTTFNEGSNFALDLNNQVKGYYTYSANAGPSELPSTDLVVNGSFDVIWSSDDDAARGLFTKASTLTQAAMTFTIAHANGMAVTFTMPAVTLKTPKTDPKPGELILQTLGYEAALNITATAPATITASVVNSSWLPIA